MIAGHKSISDSDSKHSKLDWEGERVRGSVHSTLQRAYYGDGGLSVTSECTMVMVDLFAMSEQATVMVEFQRASNLL